MTADNDMVERVAKAIRDNIEAALPDEAMLIDYDYAAIAAIGEMREPTEAMAASFQGAISRWLNEEGEDADVWRAMIDAALKREGE